MEPKMCPAVYHEVRRWTAHHRADILVKIMESSCWKGCTNKPKRTSSRFRHSLTVSRLLWVSMQCPRRKDTKVWVQISTSSSRESCSANNSLRTRKYKVNISSIAKTFLKEDHGSDLSRTAISRPLRRKRMLYWHRPTTTKAICIVVFPEPKAQQLKRTCAIAESNRFS
ncbi:hypothetical protein B0H14DRAFT_2882752 [Mycena olivaceomarginata]|nr:hypothetical protein B0H14DRAFT_2882752 [Mycena olivaceomarginata]